MQSWIPFMPEAASTVARQVDNLYFYLVGLTVFFSTLISLAIIFFVIKYRRRSPTEIPRPIAGSHRLEIVWSVVPFVIAMSIFVWSTMVYFSLYRVPADATEIYVVGKQWMWKIQHQTGQREINELHVPVGKRIKLTMTSEDTIHDFFVPAFRVKQDVLPGRYTSLWFEATTPGKYHLFCAEYCGTNHSGMGGWVYVMEPKEFENWLAGNANQQTPAASGEVLFSTLGCVSCHGATGEGGRGPTLTGLFGKQVAIENGQMVAADEEYLRESIENPGAKLVLGYKAIMPTFRGSVTEEQMLQLIAYMKSLNTAGTAPASTPPVAPTNANTSRPNQ